MMWIASRAQVPAYGWWRRLLQSVRDTLTYLGAPMVTVGTSAVIPDMEGRLLLVRHPHRRPAWGLPSGLVQRHELASSALKRELREELGLTATVERQLHWDHEPHRHVLSLRYLVTVSRAPSYGPEIDAHRYATLDELPGLLGWTAPPWLREAVATSGLSRVQPMNGESGQDDQ